MNRYGQAITWSALSAPHLFTGQCMAYSYDDEVEETVDEDESGDVLAVILDGRKAAINFEAKVTNVSTDFLDLSAGAAITVSGISTGTVLCNRAVETWRLRQPKMCSISAMHYPDLVQASPVAAGTALTTFTPTQSGLTVVTPGSKII